MQDDATTAVNGSGTAVSMLELATRGATDGATLTEEVHAAFMLGLSIAELMGRVSLAELGSDVTGDALWAASMWRVNFTRLSRLHFKLFPDSASGSTRFEPGRGVPTYLFPSDLAETGPDYADIGISSREPNGVPMLADFPLRETTRRALNCLALAMLRVDDSLVPDIIADQQWRLVSAIEAQPGASAGAVRDPATGYVSAATLALAKMELVKQLQLYLRLWEAYLRERFYAAGVTQDDQTRLIAFEAGRGMAGLSWGVTVRMLNPTPGQPLDLVGIWQAAFEDRRVSRLQHQLAVMGSALERAAPDPASQPRLAMLTVKRSLDHWQRAITWLTDGSGGARVEMTADRWGRLRVTLIEQVGIWEALALGQEDVSAYTAEALVQRVLQEVVATFEDLAMKEGLFDAAADVRQQVSDVVTTNTNAVRHLVGQQLGILSLALWPLLVILGLLAVVALGAVILRLWQGQPLGAPDVGGLVVGVLGGLGIFGVHRQSSAAAAATAALPVAATPAAAVATAAQTPVAQPTGRGLVDRLGSVLGSARDDVMQAFEHGFERIQTDLKELSSAVAVSYPLVEYFVLDPAYLEVCADYDFMVQVIWNNTDRREEVMRVAYAAFGPLGAFAMAKVASQPRPSASPSAPSPLA